MTSVSLVALVTVLWARLRGTATLPFSARWAAFDPPWRLTIGCALALAPLLIIQVLILVTQTRLENGGPTTEWQKHLPLPVYDAHTVRRGLHVTLSYCALATGLLESAALGVIALAARRRIERRLVTVLAGAAATMCVIALCAPALATNDPYEFAATSLLGFGAYSPAPHALDRTVYASIQGHIPLHGVIYGPLWVAVNQLEIGLVPSVLGKILMLRAVNAGLLVGLAFLLARAGVERAVLVLLIANPAVWYYVVLSPHADIIALVFCAGAWMCSQRSRTWAAALLLAAAGSIKITFLIIGAAALAPIATPARRIAAWVSAALLVAGAALLVPRNGYFGDVAKYVPYSQHLSAITESRLWMVAAALAVAASVALVVSGLRVPAASWLFGQLAPIAAPWYLMWALPYALVTGAATALFVSLPLATAAIDFNFDVSPLGECLATLVCGALVVDVIRSRDFGKGSGRSRFPELMR